MMPFVGSVQSRQMPGDRGQIRGCKGDGAGIGGGGRRGFFIRGRKCSKIDSAAVNILKAANGTLQVNGLRVCVNYTSITWLLC